MKVVLKLSNKKRKITFNDVNLQFTDNGILLSSCKDDVRENMFVPYGAIEYIITKEYI